MSTRNTPRRPRLERISSSESGRLGWGTRFAFAVLIAATVFVFAKLPEWGEEKNIEPRVTKSEELSTDPSSIPTSTASVQRVEPRIRSVSAAPSPRRPLEESPGESVPERELQTLLSEGLKRLHEGELELAKELFEKARVLRPDSRDVNDGLARVREELRLKAIAEHRDEALRLERNEEWQRALAEHQAVLAIDTSVRFALEGQTRARERSDLQSTLAFHVESAHRLSDGSVLEEAKRTLEIAGAIENPGPKHLAQTARLTDLVEEYETPIPVELVSDGFTDVTVYRVGHLGQFERRTVPLRPGTYTVVGSRSGFRDVRHELTVAKSSTSGVPTLTVRCTESI